MTSPASSPEQIIVFLEALVMFWFKSFFLELVSEQIFFFNAGIFFSGSPEVSQFFFRPPEVAFFSVLFGFGLSLASASFSIKGDGT